MATHILICHWCGLGYVAMDGAGALARNRLAVRASHFLLSKWSAKVL